MTVIDWLQGALIGIIVGCVVGGLLLIGICVYFLMFYRKAAQANDVTVGQPPDRIPPPSQIPAQNKNQQQNDMGGYSSY